MRGLNKLAALSLILFLGGCVSSHIAKVSYETVPDDHTKVLKGVINRDILDSDSTFGWFKENMKWGKADPAAIEAFSKNKDKFTVIIFGGTWCHDTQNLLPVFYRLVDKSGFPDKSITLVAVDRNKEAPHKLHEKYHIENVPTFIVLKDGKEVGRVTEYGKYNAIDKELGEIVSAHM